MTFAEILKAASQGLGGGSAGAAQTGYGVKTSLEKIQAKISSEAGVLGGFVGRMGGAGALRAAANGGNSASAQQEVSLLASQAAGITPAEWGLIAAALFGGYFLWRKLKR